MRAILSVSNKTGLAEFAKRLAGVGIELYSTGGTKKSLESAGVPVRSISDLTGFPEILDGRVKTLHPNVHGGILARRDLPEHMRQVQERRIGLIDMVVVNLYPFVETVSKANVSLQDALEQIDIGGPTMIRASAKNFPHVIVVVDPGDYDAVAKAFESVGGLDPSTGSGLALEQRKRLAQKAFQHTALYDTAISRYLSDRAGLFPDELTVGLVKAQGLRYGENPHQQATFYREVLSLEGGIAAAKQLHGKELSFNNILDADAAWRAASDFDEPTVAVIKHTNPCGLASHGDLAEAYRRAYAGDPVSAFGGIVAFNRPLTMAAAEEVRKIFYEIVIAPGYEPEALALLQKKRDLRILEAPQAAAVVGLDYRKVQGGMLVQTQDAIMEDPRSWKVVTNRKPTEQEMADLAFAWRAVKHIKSNAIVLAKDKTLVGMGAGQPNRVTSVHLALRRAEERARGCALGSDAFFPFADGVELAAKGGVTAVAQPGGSIRDNEVIEVANKAGMAMVFTGIRHFKH